MRPLTGCAVAITRQRRGELGRLLHETGADVVHVPLIEVVDVGPEDVEALAQALAAAPDWVVVTSPAGAERVAPLLTGGGTRVAAVGTATARTIEEVTGAAPSLVPDRQTGIELAHRFNHRHDAPQRVVVAQADRASADLVDALCDGGHDVRAITAYHTRLRRPTDDEIARLTSADVVTFASGSAASAWAEALGDRVVGATPDIVVVIGPSTAAAAWESGLKVTDIAADHSVAGLVDAITRAWELRR